MLVGVGSSNNTEITAYGSGKAFCVLKYDDFILVKLNFFLLHEFGQAL